MDEVITIYGSRGPGKSTASIEYLRHLMALGDQVGHIKLAISPEIAEQVRQGPGGGELDFMVAAGRVVIIEGRLYGHTIWVVQDVDEFKDWGPDGTFIEAKTYRPGQIVKLDAERYMAMAERSVEIPPPARYPAHDAPNRRRFKRSQRKR